MILAVVVDEKEQILPIVEGTILRIYDTESHQKQDFSNPAQHVTEGRRGATLRFAEEKGATVFVAPPNTFCELSYQAARKNNVNFLNILKNTNFKSFEESLVNKEIALQTFLPDEDIVPSH